MVELELRGVGVAWGALCPRCQGTTTSHDEAGCSGLGRQVEVVGWASQGVEVASEALYRRCKPMIPDELGEAELRHG